MNWFYAIPSAGHLIQDLYLYVAFLLLAAGFIHVFIVFHKSFQPGRKLGASFAGILIYFQWLAAAAAIYWVAPFWFHAAWNSVEVAFITACALIGVVSFMFTRKLLFHYFVKRAGLTRFESLVPRFSKEQRRVFAVHEAGHLLVHASVESKALPTLEARLTRGFSGIAGYVRSFQSGVNCAPVSADFLHWEAMMVLAGDQATSIVLNARFTGAESDMERWWSVAQRIMTAGLGVAAWPVETSMESSVMRLQAIELQLQAHRNVVTQFLSRNQNLLVQIAAQLERTGSLTDAQCRQFLSRAVATELLPAIKREHVLHHRRRMKIR